MGKATVREVAKVGCALHHHHPRFPRERRINIHPGDVVVIEASEEGNELTIRPQLTVDRSQAWFWSESWQKNERDVERDISGRQGQRRQNEGGVEGARG